jgi:hypothetical protein
MKALSLRTTVVAGAGLLALAAAFVSVAQPQIRATPSYLPMGTAASGNTSTAWFHEPSSGRILACQAVHGAGGAIASIQCTSAQLP